jgi:hypothetical protein
MIVTTKISRAEMAIAKRVGPQYIKKISVEKREEAKKMLTSIIERMDRLVASMCRSSYHKFQHFTDRAMSLDDLIATVKAGLVLGIYRYKRTGKYEPYNYLMGVINIILRNVHNWRNRKKRIPFNVMLSLDAIPEDDAQNLIHYLTDSDIPVSSSAIERKDMCWDMRRVKSSPKGKTKWRRLKRGKKVWEPIVPHQFGPVTGRQRKERNITVSRPTDIMDSLSPLIGVDTIGSWSSRSILALIVAGGNANSIARDTGVQLASLKSFIKRNITIPLGKETIDVTEAVQNA